MNHRRTAHLLFSLNIIVGCWPRLPLSIDIPLLLRLQHEISHLNVPTLHDRMLIRVFIREIATIADTDVFISIIVLLYVLQIVMLVVRKALIMRLALTGSAALATKLSLKISLGIPRIVEYCIRAGVGYSCPARLCGHIHGLCRFFARSIT
ncbi:hypothetical protein Taro_006781 [Colocasia esculenta]|uniref:Secreted protein n=1 Tax=Colocasia esculenta TaxID=4460 RepID=A0A843TYG1_COLES|nr:hypothetical protein [Colocasia esculenta]